MLEKFFKVPSRNFSRNLKGDGFGGSRKKFLNFLKESLKIF